MAGKPLARHKRISWSGRKTKTSAESSSHDENRPKAPNKQKKLIGLLSFFVFAIFFSSALYVCIRHFSQANSPSESLMKNSSSVPTVAPTLKAFKKRKLKKKGIKDEGNIPPEIKNFQPRIHNILSPQPITHNGRKIRFTELMHENKQSSVRVYIADGFLSKRECDGLLGAHMNHLKSSSKQTPIFCFAGLDTMQKHLDEIGYNRKAHMNDFSRGTWCVNESFSNKISSKFKYSYSTSFYRDESKFAGKFEQQIEAATRLALSHGGKFQITSYQTGVGYKNHTDCTEDDEMRDRFATVLVYLQDVKQGGETKFPKLGISVKPKQGRLLVWNNMRPDGSCDPTSVHNAAKVIDGHKVIIQRWYYYKSFYSLGKRPQEPDLPKRQQFQPRVSCDEYEHGSCRWYDEWGYDHLVDYRLLQHQLS